MGKDGPTDVLAFPIDDPIESGRWPDRRPPAPIVDLRSSGAPMLLGDVVMCPAVAARQAPDHAGTYDDELALLVVHGVLHVLGMDHAEADEAAAMQARERELLDRLPPRPMTALASPPPASRPAAPPTFGSADRRPARRGRRPAPRLPIVLALAETALTRVLEGQGPGPGRDGRAPRARCCCRWSSTEQWLNPLLLVVAVDHARAVHPRSACSPGACSVAGAVVGALSSTSCCSSCRRGGAEDLGHAAHRPRGARGGPAGEAPRRAAAAALALARRSSASRTCCCPGKGLARGPYISEEELLAVADLAVEDDVIEEDERALIESVIELGDTVVREVMVPRPDMVTVTSDFRIADAMEVVILNGYSRIPVCGDGIDDVVGVVYAKDLMRAERDGQEERTVGELARPSHHVPETKRVASLLREMQQDRFHLAIVVDEYGGTAGLVTLEDIIEELVGEIVDEFDVEDPMIEPLPDGDVRVNARMPLDEVNDLLHAHLPEGDWDTVGGLFLSELGHVPTNGERVVVDGWELTAQRVQGRRIGRIRIHRLPVSRSTPSASTAPADAVRLRHVRRPPQRREVDAAQPHPAHEGGHHLRQAADDPHPHPRRALAARRARSCSSTRPASTSRARRSAPASTPPPRAPSATSTWCASWSTPPSRSGAVTSGWPTCCRRTPSASSTRSTPRRRTSSPPSWPPPAALELAAYFPLSAKTGDGTEALIQHLIGLLPEGPQYFPDDMVTDVPEAFWVAELVREQLLRRTHDELPHSIAARVTEWDPPLIRCEILVERDSQKGIVIGKKGQVLKEVGIAGARAAARGHLPRAPRQGRQGLAEPPQGHGALRLLSLCLLRASLRRSAGWLSGDWATVWRARPARPPTTVPLMRMNWRSGPSSSSRRSAVSSPSQRAIVLLTSWVISPPKCTTT